MHPSWFLLWWSFSWGFFSQHATIWLFQQWFYNQDLAKWALTTTLKATGSYGIHCNPEGYHDIKTPNNFYCIPIFILDLFQSIWRNFYLQNFTSLIKECRSILHRGNLECSRFKYKYKFTQIKITKKLTQQVFHWKLSHTNSQIQIQIYTNTNIHK